MGLPRKFDRYRLDNWEGLNTYSSATDLRPGEAVTLDELEIRRGKLVLGGESSAIKTDTGKQCNRMWVYADANDTFYVLLASPDGSSKTTLRYMSWNGSVWSAISEFSDNMFYDATEWIPCSYQSGGDLRIAGSLHTSTYSPPRLVRYWQATSRWNSNVTRTAGIYNDSAEISPPNDMSEFNSITINTSAAASSFTSGDSVMYALSYVYQGEQESPLTIRQTVINPTSSTKGQIALSIANAAWVTNSAGRTLLRVERINIYRQLNGGDWYLLTEIDVNDGETSSGTNWAYAAGAATITVLDDGSDLVDTYVSRTGYADAIFEDGTYTYYNNTFRCHFGAATVCQGRAVIGNVGRIEGTDSAIPKKIYNDRLYFSPIGRLDSFYKHDWVDIETGDGDSINHLETFGTHVLVFKENNTYVWDMGSRSRLNWRQIGRFNGMGVTSFAHVVNTPYGVIFWGKTGLYIYNGIGRPKELARDTIRDTLQALDHSTTPVSVGFNPKTNVVYVGDLGNASDMYRIDLDDGWAGKRTVVGSSVVSKNMDNFQDGSVFAAYESGSTNTDVIDLDGATSLSLTPTYKSGELNLGNDHFKRVTKIRVRYKATGNTCSVTFAVDGGAGTDIGTLAASATMTTAELYPTVNNYGRVFSVQVAADGDLSVFELDSIEFSGKVYDG